MAIEISLASFDGELATLSYRYAAALDHRDVTALLSVFHPEATLRAYPVGRNPMVLSSHRELPKIIQAIEYWPRTHHMVGQSMHQRRDDLVLGETYCTAHHFSAVQPGTGDDYVMHLRYVDEYVRGVSGDWLIYDRSVLTDAVERRDVTTGGP